jgi:hypothetical protein
LQQPRGDISIGRNALEEILLVDLGHLSVPIAKFICSFFQLVFTRFRNTLFFNIKDTVKFVINIGTVCIPHLQKIMYVYNYANKTIFKHRRIYLMCTAIIYKLHAFISFWKS